MQFVRKATLVVVVPLFSLLLFSLAVDIGFVRVVTHPDKIKQILNDSGVYSSVVSGLLDQAKQVSSNNGDISLSNTQVRSAADQAITPTFLKQNTETFIDSVYRWLDGKSASPDFLIDLTGVKTQFADNVANNLQPQLAALPVCSAGANVQSFDAFNATCLPRGVTAAQAVASVKSDILNGKGFLDNPAITAKDLKSSDSNQSVFSDNLKDAPRGYQRAKSSPVVLAMLALLVAAAIIFLSPTRRSGVKRVGITLLSIGVFMVIFAWGLNQATTKALPKIKLNNVVLQEKVKVLARDIVKEVDNTYYMLGITYAVVGVASVAGTMFLFKGRGAGPGKKYTPDHQPPTSDKTATPAEPDNKLPSKKTIVVQ